MKKYESLVAVERERERERELHLKKSGVLFNTLTHTSNSIKITEGGNTFISDNQKQADYIK